MVSSAIWKKTCTSEFFKDDRNCTSPKDEWNLKSLKNSRLYYHNYISICSQSSACVILSHTVNKLFIYFNSTTCLQRSYSKKYNIILIYMKKFLHFDWLRAVQFLGNTVPKKEIQCQKKKFSANFFRF